MSIDATAGENLDRETPPVPSGLAAMRLVAAALLTFALLPYSAGRTVVVGLLTGQPEHQYLYVAAATLGAIACITFQLGRDFVGSKYERKIPWLIGIGWILSNLGIMFMSVGPLLAWHLVALAFLPAMLWLPWLGWFFYPASGATRRVAVLAVLGAVSFGIFAKVLKVDGLTGDSKVNFTWKWATPDKPGAASFAKDPPGISKSAAVDLATTTPDDYPQYLGASRLGMLTGTKLSDDWKSRPPRMVWRKPVGLGWGAFAVVGDFAVTQEQRDSNECVVCYRVSTGEQMWEHAEAVRFVSGMGGDGPRCTPTIANGRVFAIGATGILVCLGADGKLAWRVDVLKDNDAENVYHGVCGSPLVFDGKVVVSPTGGNGKSLAAYDAATGKRLWQAGDKRTSYSSPALATLAGVKQILLHNAHELTGHDASDGKILWRFAWTNPEKVNCSQAIPGAGAPDNLFISTGYGTGSALLGVQRSSSGPGLTTETLWKNKNLKAKFCTVVLHKGFLYGLDDGILTCLDVATGSRRWKAGRYQHGQILLAGDLLLIQAEAGDVVLVRPSPEGLKELARLPALGGKTWNHPALAGKHLLVRNDVEAICFELPTK